MTVSDSAVPARHTNGAGGRLRALVVLGTRPEVIKLAPVVWALEREGSFEPLVCVVGQQGDILRKGLEEWGITPAFAVDLSAADRRLAATLAAMLPMLADCIERARPDVVLVEGDTTTNVGAALAAFYAGVPVAHVEAGLRTHDPRLPFPEEMHRRVVDRLATLHYAPTDGALQNLAAEGITGGSVAMVGNTVVDALKAVVRDAAESGAGADRRTRQKRTLVVTAHRRESFGGGIARICKAVAWLVTSRTDLRVVYVLHPNPRARRPALELLSGMPNVELIEPLPYREFVRLLGIADIVLTDSGGIQEEAPYLGVPVLVTRPSTERPEVQQVGGAWLVGTAASRIVSAVQRLLDDDALRAEMAQVRTPFGDGEASARIARHLAVYLSAAPRHVAGSAGPELPPAGGRRAATVGFPMGDSPPAAAAMPVPAAVPGDLAEGLDLRPMALEGAS